MAIPGSSDEEKRNDESGSREEQASPLGAPMPGEDPNARPLASSSFSQAARSFESKFAARRKKRLEETAAALTKQQTDAAEGISQSSVASSHNTAHSEGSGTFSAARLEEPELDSATPGGVDGEIGSDAGIDDNARKFLQKLSGKYPTDETLQEPEKSSSDVRASDSTEKLRDSNVEKTAHENASEPAAGLASASEEGWHKVSDSLKGVSSSKSDETIAGITPTSSPAPASGGTLGKEFDFKSAVRSLAEKQVKGDREVSPGLKNLAEAASADADAGAGSGAEPDSPVAMGDDPEVDQRNTIIENYAQKPKITRVEDPGWDQKSTIIEKFKPGDLKRRDEPGWDQKSTIIEKFNPSDLTRPAGVAKTKLDTVAPTLPASAGAAAAASAAAAAGASGVAAASSSSPEKTSPSGSLGSSSAISPVTKSAGESSTSSGSTSSGSLSPSAPSPETAPAPPVSQTDSAVTRAGFKPRKDLSSYRSFDSGKASGSSALSGPGGSADAKLFGGMSSAPEDLPPDEPQTPEERKKALDAIGYKRGTSLPSEVSGGPAPSTGPVKNDQFVPPTLQPGPSAGAGAGSDVGWQSVPKDESKPKGGAFAAARRSQTLGPVELAAKKKDEEAKAPAIEKPKPYRGREEEVHIPKNRWGQVPDTATARSVWADQLGITKPASTMRGPSSSLRGRLKRVMSADIFNVRELYSLRGIAALIVFIAQAQIFAAHAKPGYPINMIGAQIFFVMSGFVITRWLMVNETGSLQRTLGEFYARRALRIFPMYYLVLCVLMFTGHLSNAESFFCGLFNFSAFQSIKVAPQLLQYWTLCVELQFYVLFPILLMITPQRFRMALVVLLTGATVACTYLSAQSTPHAQDWLLLPISGQYIMWGCLAGYMDVKSDIALSLNASMCVILGIFSQIGIHTWLLAYSNIPTSDISDLLWKGLSTINALSLSMLIFGLWRTSNAWLRGLCANDVLVYFGKISYGFYILLPLCFFMQPSIIAVMPILAKVPAVVTSFVITFIMAVVTFHYLQTPINNVREHLPIAR